MASQKFGLVVGIFAEKGGPGKTTTAVNLAVQAAHQGIDVLIIDADPQQSASKFIARRNANEHKPTVNCQIQTGSLTASIKDAITRYEMIIIDAGGRASKELISGMCNAHVVYTPTAPSLMDLETMEKFSEMVNQAKEINPELIVYAYLSRVKYSQKKAKLPMAKEFLAESFPDFKLSDVCLSEREVFQNASNEGLGVVEMKNAAEASEEVRALLKEILEVTNTNFKGA